MQQNRNTGKENCLAKTGDPAHSPQFQWNILQNKNHLKKYRNEVSVFHFDSVKTKLFQFCDLKGFVFQNFALFFFLFNKNIQNPRKRFPSSSNKNVSLFDYFFFSFSAAAQAQAGRRSAFSSSFLRPSPHHSASGTNSAYVLQLDASVSVCLKHFQHSECLVLILFLTQVKISLAFTFRKQILTVHHRAMNLSASELRGAINIKYIPKISSCFKSKDLHLERIQNSHGHIATVFCKFQCH